MIIIRNAKDDDASAIAELWHSAWRDGHRGLVPEGLMQYRTLTTFIPRAASRIPHSIVALSGDNQLLGFVSLRGLELEQIFVDGAARGTGIATQLMRAGEQRLVKDGAEEAFLVVVDGNSRAIQFYEREGWERGDLIDYEAEIDGGTFAMPCRRYTKRLT
jgi:ribosomal protein S18 acetylase RimI-like enzyme